MTQTGRETILGCIHQMTGGGCFVNCLSASTPVMFERNSSAIFNVTPCISLRTDVLARHADSCMHKSAISREHERLASEQGGRDRTSI